MKSFLVFVFLMAIVLANLGGYESRALYGEQNSIDLKKMIDNPAQWKNPDYLNTFKRQKINYNFNLAPRASQLVKNRLKAKNLF